jgi:AraC-like DNA-binding protein
MAGKILKESLVPGSVPEDKHVELWRLSISPFFDAHPVMDTIPPKKLPDICQYHLNKALFIESTFTGQKFNRDKKWMARYADTDHVLLQLFTSGTNNVINGDTSYVERPGNIYAVNLAYQVKAVSEDARVLTLVLPRDLIAEEIPRLAELCGVVFEPESISARVFVDHMISLRNHLPEARAEEASVVLRGTLGLLDALLQHRDVESSVSQDATLCAICRFIDSNLDNSSFGIDNICARFRCSRSTVYRLFKPHGGVREYIQRRRLMACFRAIISPKLRRRRIFDIALDFGFTSPSHFSHLFHGHFGMTPSEARDASLREPLGAMPVVLPACGTAQDSAERMWRWAKTLAVAPNDSD